MKERELRQHTQCDLCHRKLGQTEIPLFWMVTVERYGLDLKAIERQQGMAMMMGGNATLAMHMGPDENLAQQLMEATKLTVCETCAHTQPVLMAALSKQEDG